MPIRSAFGAMQSVTIRAAGGNSTGEKESCASSNFLPMCRLGCFPTAGKTGPTGCPEVRGERSEKTHSFSTARLSEFLLNRPFLRPAAPSCVWKHRVEVDGVFRCDNKRNYARRKTRPSGSVARLLREEPSAPKTPLLPASPGETASVGALWLAI